jgi:hypothetical protein
MPNSFDRRDGESARAFHCFTVFLHAGADRSVISAYRQVTGKTEARAVSGAWNHWVLTHEWQERAVAFDNFVQQVELEERRRALRADEKKWAARRDALREREFNTAEQLIAKGEQILKLPILEQHIEKSVVVDGQTIPTLTIVNPVRGAMQAATKMIAHGALLLRRSTQMEKHEDEGETEQTGAKVIRFPVAVPDVEEWSNQYKKA